MNTGYRSLAEFQTELERREATKEDYIVATKSLRAIDDDVLTFGAGEHRMLHTTHNQIAQWAGIPKKYYDRMTEIPGLRAYNLNQWFDHSDDRRMVRTLDDSARAYLSDRFRPIDHMQIMDAAAPALSAVPDLQVKTVNLTDDRMYVQFILPSLQAEIMPNDVVEAGICLTNSETGQGAVDIQMMLWRLVCTNGMVAGSIMRNYHVGRRVGGDVDDYSIYRQDTIEADLASYKLRLRDTLENSLNEKSWREMVVRIQSGAKDPIHRPEPTIKNVTKRYELTREERDRVMFHFIGSGNANRWNLANALTETAKELPSADRQYQFERNGWDVLTMAPAQWNSLNEGPAPEPAYFALTG